MAEEFRLSWFGKIGFTVLLILLILLLGATMGIIIGSKTRIKRLEDRIIKLESIEYRLTQIWEQAESFDQFKDRLDKLEAASLKMASFDQLKDRLDKLEAASSKTAYLVRNLDRLSKASSWFDANSSRPISARLLFCRQLGHGIRRNAKVG